MQKIIVVHNCKRVVELRSGSERIDHKFLTSKGVINQLYQVCNKYPNFNIVWVNEIVRDNLNYKILDSFNTTNQIWSLTSNRRFQDLVC